MPQNLWHKNSWNYQYHDMHASRPSLQQQTITYLIHELFYYVEWRFVPYAHAMLSHWNLTRYASILFSWSRAFKISSFLELGLRWMCFLILKRVSNKTWAVYCLGVTIVEASRHGPLILIFQSNYVGPIFPHNNFY